MGVLTDDDLKKIAEELAEDRRKAKDLTQTLADRVVSDAK